MGYDSLPPSSAVSSSVRARLSELRRPPIPPQSHIRVQKQIKLLKKPPTYPVGATLTLPVLSRSTNGDHGDYRGSYSRESSVSSTQYSRSPSPISSCRSSQLSSAVSNGSRSGRSLTPRRVFPQTYQRDNSLNVSELRAKEQSPVVFDGRMSFVLGCKNQNVYQTVQPTPAHTDPETASYYLSAKINDFLKRTDHVNEEWQKLGRSDSSRSISKIESNRERAGDSSKCRRSKSVTNIMVKGFQLMRDLPPTSRCSSSADLLSDDATIMEDFEDEELSEMNVELSEERSTANLANERLESETTERLRLEKDVHEQKRTIQNLQEMSEKLEMDLICAKSDLNGISEDEDHEGGDGDEHFSAYKLKYERAAREIEFIKRRLQTQHEHDLEQLIALKKQLEKKLADAYEEVEEQRQVVGQWKRKVQKMTYETNDLRMLLEEQNGRNNMLEKRQRKFDSECQTLQDVARQERVAKERLSREKDVLLAEKFTLEQNLADIRLEFDLKEEKLSTLQREFEEMTFNGGTEEEIAQLKRSKMDFERKCKELEEELDEMAGQVQLLEQTKLRLEMTLETMRKEARREAQQRDEELEEVRGSACKKIKALECQLETEHEERTFLLREKHELERRLQSTEERDRTERAEEEATIQKLKRDLRKYRALLKDAQTQLERVKVDTPGKSLIRQLRNQLDDAETAKAIAIKSRQAIESDLNDIQAQLEETQRARAEADERAVHAQRDRAELQAQIEENEEETAELMKKYRAAVKQLNIEQMAMSEYEMKFAEMESEKKSLKDQLADMQTRLDNVENMTDSSVMVQTKRLELRTKELESRLELEQATRTRLELQTTRQKDALERAQSEVAQARSKEAQLHDANKKVQKSLRDLREEFQTVSNREQESIAKRKEMEKKMESVEAETASVRNDLRLALQRIADLQHAMEEDDDNPTDSDETDDTDDSLSDSQLMSIPIRVTKTISRTVENGVFDTQLVIKEDLDTNTRQSTELPNTSAGSGRP